MDGACSERKIDDEKRVGVNEEGGDTAWKFLFSYFLGRNRNRPLFWNGEMGGALGAIWGDLMGA